MEGRPRITSQLADGRTVVEKSRYKMRARVKITCLVYVIVVSGIVISFASCPSSLPFVVGRNNYVRTYKI